MGLRGVPTRADGSSLPPAARAQLKFYALYDSAHCLEPKRYSVAALYERRQIPEIASYVFGGLSRNDAVANVGRGRRTPPLLQKCGGMSNCRP